MASARSLSNRSRLMSPKKRVSTTLPDSNSSRCTPGTSTGQRAWSSAAWGASSGWFWWSVLKSCSANVGAAVLSRYCAEAESLARKAETEEVRRCITKIETEHRSVQTALVSEIETLAASSA